MEFVVSEGIWKEALTKIEKVLNAKNSIPILSGVLLEAREDCMLLTASDGTESIIHRIPVDGGDTITVVNTGKTVLPKDCLEVGKKLKGPIKFAIDGFSLKISQDKTTLNFTTMDPAEYPKIDVNQKSQPIVFSGKDFGTMVAKTKFSVSKSDTRPILQGIHMKFTKEGIVFTSTDSHRLSQVAAGAYEGDTKLTVPAKTLENAVSCFDLSHDVVIIPSETNIAIANANTIFYSRLLDGNYPDTSKLIPSLMEFNLVVDKAEFQSALEILSSIAKENVVTLKVDGMFVEITAKGETSNGSRQVAFESYDGKEDFTIGFSAKYVLEAIKSMSCKSLTIGFNGAMKPFIIKPVLEDSSELQLVLPVRQTA